MTNPKILTDEQLQDGFEEIEREHVHIQPDLFDDQDEIIGDEEWELMMDEQYRLELMEEQIYMEEQHRQYYDELENMWEFNQG